MPELESRRLGAHMLRGTEDGDPEEGNIFDTVNMGKGISANKVPLSQSHKKPEGT